MKDYSSFTILESRIRLTFSLADWDIKSKNFNISEIVF